MEHEEDEGIPVEFTSNWISVNYQKLFHYIIRVTKVARILDLFYKGVQSGVIKKGVDRHN